MEPRRPCASGNGEREHIPRRMLMHWQSKTGPEKAIWVIACLGHLHLAAVLPLLLISIRITHFHHHQLVICVVWHVKTPDQQVSITQMKDSNNG